MPFKSEAQRRYLWANEPEIARDWTDTYGSRIQKKNGGITSTKTVKGQPHLLAYITPNEVEKLKALGGQETMTKEGIPAYPEFDNYTESSLKGTSSAGSGLTRDEFESGAYEGTGSGQLNQAQKDAFKKAEIEAAEKIKEEFIRKSKKEPPPLTWQQKHENFRKRRNIELAKKRALKKFKDVEQYVDEDIYGLSGQQMAEKRGYVFDNQGNVIGYDRDKATAYGYDTSKLDPGVKELVSNKGTSIEKKRKNLYDVNSVDHWLTDTIRPDTQHTVLNTLGKGADYTVLSQDPNISSQKLEDLRNLGKTPEQINPPDQDGYGGVPGATSGYMGYPSYEAWLAAQQGAPVGEEVEEKITTQLANTDWPYPQYGTVGYEDVIAKKFGPTSWARDGGRIPAAFGGIMDTETGRRGYFLGSIKKAFKGVAKAAGKVLKSDIGKAALMAGAGWYLGGGRNPFTFAGRSGFDFGNIGSGISNLGKKMLLKPGMDWGDKGSLSLGKLMLTSGILPWTPLGKAPKQETLTSGSGGGKLEDPLTKEKVTPAQLRSNLNEAIEAAGDDEIEIAKINAAYPFLNLGIPYPYPNYAVAKDGGRIGAQEGGLMDLGGMEKDYRNEGGFVALGGEERADDVPARLSRNEFVFTADAVRGAGGGDIDKGAEIMENVMKNLEQGGKISEETQGNTGAQEMFSVSERIGEVL